MRKGNKNMSNQARQKIHTKKEALLFLDSLIPKEDEYYDCFLETRRRLKEKNK